jgi:RNA polymerase sigma factor (sigma-70 family)
MQNEQTLVDAALAVAERLIDLSFACGSHIPPGHRCAQELAEAIARFRREVGLSAIQPGAVSYFQEWRDLAGKTWLEAEPHLDQTYIRSIEDAINLKARVLFTKSRRDHEPRWIRSSELFQEWALSNATRAHNGNAPHRLFTFFLGAARARQFQIANERRRLSRRRESTLPEQQEPSAETRCPFEALLAAEDRAKALTELESLTANQREQLRLHLSGRTHAQIGDILGLSPEAVEGVLRRLKVRSHKKRVDEE